MAFDLDLIHLRIGHFDAFGVFLVAKVRANLESFFGSRRANELEHGFIALQGLGRPVGGYEGKQTMFDGVPLRGPRRVMTNSDLET